MMASTSNPHFRSPKHPRNAQLMALIAMASFGMLFGTFLLSFLLAQARNAVWPPIGVEPVSKIYAYLATGVILASSLLYTAGQRARLTNVKQAKWSYLVSWTLAWIFLALQYTTLKAMWAHGQGLSSDIYSGSVHVLVGLHALHLLGGLAGLTYILAKTFFTAAGASEISTQIVGWFWHFLGMLWGLIFLVLVL